jgi:1-piperideine-2-carboxylate/1-pyrroline-2-carboxylate reductase [NAD(P)H]
MRVLSPAETRAALPYPALVESLRQILLEKKAGRAFAPERARLEFPGGLLLTMPATDPEFTCVKIITLHGENAARGLPSIQGEVLLMRTDTGERLALLDGATVTERRTAALSALAARTLAPVQRGSLLVVGSGVQARAHVEAMRETLEIQRVWISSRDPKHAAHLARALDATPLGSANSVLEEADFICTTTTATAPVIGARVKPGAFIAAVGAYRADMSEIPPELTREARVVVDTLEGAKTEAGDVIQAGVDWNNVESLEDALETTPRDGVTLFKSVGFALWDLAAARLAYEQFGKARGNT